MTLIDQEVERLWGVIRTITSERESYAADRDRLAAQILALQEGAGEAPLLSPEGVAAAFTRAFARCDHEQRVTLFKQVMAPFAEYMIANGVFAHAAYEEAANAGISVFPLHYYSPIAGRAEIEAHAGSTLSTALAAEKFDRPAQAARLASLLAYAPELTDVPVNLPKQGGFHWGNGMFGPQDAFTYYALIRKFNPARVLEVGSGFSTLIAARAAARNRTTRVICIEPYPTDTHNSHLREEAGFRLIEKPVQQIGLELFTSLQENDILFIDSSHVAKPGSDVEFLFFEVLPRVAPGVLVHIRHIFLPRGYNHHYYIDQQRHWNENYLLGALLLENPRWQVEIANAFIAGFGQSAELDALVAALAGGRADIQAALAPCAGGGSLWLRRLPG